MKCLFFGNAEAGQRSAVIYTIIESSKAARETQRSPKGA
jgi:hypothetical protein